MNLKREITRALTSVPLSGEFKSIVTEKIRSVMLAVCFTVEEALREKVNDLDI